MSARLHVLLYGNETALYYLAMKARDITKGGLMLLPPRPIRHLILSFAHVIEMHSGSLLDKALCWVGLATVSSALQFFLPLVPNRSTVTLTFATSEPRNITTAGKIATEKKGTTKSPLRGQPQTLLC